MRSFMENHSLTWPFIFNSQNVWSGSKKMRPIFHKLHVTENAIGVPNHLLSLISTKSILKIYPKAFCALVFDTVLALCRSEKIMSEMHTWRGSTYNGFSPIYGPNEQVDDDFVFRRSLCSCMYMENIFIAEATIQK